MIQKMIFRTPDVFEDHLNRELSKGWSIVPGTIGGVSLERPSDPAISDGSSPDVSVDRFLWAVIQKETGDGQ